MTRWPERCACAVIMILLLAQSGTSKTTVSQSDCGITVTVKIMFWGEGADQARIDGWLKEAEEIWDGPEGNQVYGDCECKVDFVFEGQVLSDNDECPEGMHCVEIKKVNPASQHTSHIMGGGKKSYGFDSHPFDTSTTGKFGTDDTGGVIAHEIGHLLGLSDDYFRYYANYTVKGDEIIIHELRITYPHWQELNDDLKKAIIEKIKQFHAIGVETTGGDADDSGEAYIDLNDITKGLYGKGTYDIPVEGYVEGGDDAGDPGEYEPPEISSEGEGSTLRPGVDPNSIMGSDYFTGKPTQGHIDQIIEGNKMECPAKCCCGNGRLDSKVGEHCDTKMDPNGCPSLLPFCDAECKCRSKGSITSTTTGMHQTTTTLGGVTGGDGDGVGTGGSGTDDSPPSTSSGVDDGCPSGSFKARSDCEASCDLEHDDCKMDYRGCYTCVPVCPVNYRSKSTCEANCDTDHGECRIRDTGCYECKETCKDPTYTGSECGGYCETSEVCIIDYSSGCYGCKPGSDVPTTTETTMPPLWSAGGCCDCAPPMGCASGPDVTEDDCPTACQPQSGTFIGNAICSQDTGNCEVVTTTTQTTTTIGEQIVTTTSTTLLSCTGGGLYDAPCCYDSCGPSQECAPYPGSSCYHCVS
ncbi:hypothetical protein ACFLRF_05190 [Candidatus Altiarchaeota archaeon]